MSRIRRSNACPTSPPARGALGPVGRFLARDMACVGGIFLWVGTWDGIALGATTNAWRLQIQRPVVLTVDGPTGARASIQRAPTATGPWRTWTQVTASAGVRLEEPVEPAMQQYYRVVAWPTNGPPGFVWIPPGRFRMGTPLDEPGRDADETPHDVTLSTGFWICDHEVTQAEYRSVIGTNPSHFLGEDLPVERVDWNDAVTYARERTLRERRDGRLAAGWAYRLPTEAEWEFTCRAGSTDAYASDLPRMAWIFETAGDQTHPVRTRQPNAWGLHDMHGNVSEWCLDWYGEHAASQVTDPVGPSTGPGRVDRGGSWLSDPRFCRSGFRNWDDPGFRDDVLGFRVVLAPAP